MLYGWKENSMLINCLAACTVPIYLQQFPRYSNCKCKKSPFSRTAAHMFVFPGDAPATITLCVVWMKRQFNACQTLRSMYLSIFNSFRVIRCLSQCVSPKIAIFTTFLFPRALGTPLGQSRWMLYKWKENSMLTNCLAACAYLLLSNYIYNFFLYNRFWDRAWYLWKIVILSYPLAFDPQLGGFPSEYCHFVRCGKTRMVELPHGKKTLRICVTV